MAFDRLQPLEKRTLLLDQPPLVYSMFSVGSMMSV